MPLTPQQKMILMRKAGDNPTMAFMEFVNLIEQQIDEKVNQKMENMAKNMPEMAIAKHIQSLKGDQGEQGIQGERGKDGYTPKKNVDYFDGIDGKKGDMGPQGETGPKGRDGLDGIDGKDGKDGKNGRDGSPDTPEQIADKLNTLDEVVDFEVIKGLKNKLEYLEKKSKSRPFFGGGGLSQTSADWRYTKFHGGASNITVSATEPVNPELYDIWIDIS